MKSAELTCSLVLRVKPPQLTVSSMALGQDGLGIVSSCYFSMEFGVICVIIMPVDINVQLALPIHLDLVIFDVTSLSVIINNNTFYSVIESISIILNLKTRPSSDILSPEVYVILVAANLHADFFQFYSCALILLQMTISKNSTEVMLI